MDPAELQPHYLRDKVALTEQERAAQDRAAHERAAQQGATPPIEPL
jgi:hypothetical protein